MAKDPAVLFYTSDFLTGVTDLTMEERGQYITILCLQHQKGRLSEKTIRLSVGSVSVDVLAKLTKDENGNFYSARMEKEIQERIKFTESRRNNGAKGGRPKNEKPNGLPNGYPNAKPSANLPEDEDEDENINKIGNEKNALIIPEMAAMFKRYLPQYPSSPSKDYKPLYAIASYFLEIGKKSGTPDQHKDDVLEAWEPICQSIANDNFYKQKSLSTISNHIQEITQNALYGKSVTKGKQSGATMEGLQRELEKRLNKERQASN
ncbi:MAG TPA: hypothetical protein VFV31_10570 [Chitinophagaceae bacterium]|nr:hypothetical protein [Chitinophagaceae bacterium]